MFDRKTMKLTDKLINIKRTYFRFEGRWLCIRTVNNVIVSISREDPNCAPAEINNFQVTKEEASALREAFRACQE